MSGEIDGMTTLPQYPDESSPYLKNEPGGAGTTGRVILVNDVNMFGRKVAIKRFSREELQQPDASGGQPSLPGQRLIEEARIIAELKHPHIIDIYFVGKYQNGVQVVMEYLDGDNLEERIRKKGVLSAEAVALMGMQLCDGLALLHEKRILHGNIRPDNIMLNKQDAPKLIGFGPLPRLMLPGSGAAPEHLAYMAPERLKNRSAANARSDIYALGATLYFACTGESPLEIAPEKLPQPLADLILNALRDDPDERFAAVRDFGETLNCVFINRRQEKIISKGKGEFECYRCQQFIPYTAFFCPFCGVEIKQVWQETETLYRETLKTVEQLVYEGQFPAATLKLDAFREACQHQHFLHLTQESEQKKNWVSEEWNKAEQKKEQLANRLKSAETALARREYDLAARIAEEIRQHQEPYFKSVCLSAQKVSDDIARIRADEQTHRENLQHLREKAAAYLRRGDFDAAQADTTRIINDINPAWHPEVLQEALQQQQWLNTEKHQADLVADQLRKRLADARIALETLNLDTAQLTAKTLEDTEGGYFQPIIDEARRVGEEARRIINTRKELERTLSRALEKAAQNRFTTAFHLLDRIINTTGKAFDTQHSKAIEAKDKIQAERKIWLAALRTEYTAAITLAESKLTGAQPLLAPALATQEKELQDLREKAQRVVRSHLIRKIAAVAGVLFILLFLLVLAFRHPSAPQPPDPQPVIAKPSGPPVQIFTKRANFRSGPDTTHSVTASIKRDDNYKLLATGMKLSPDQHPWIKVYIPELDRDGYMSAKLLVDESGKTLFPTAQIQSANCRIMETPATSGRFISVLRKDSEITLKHWVIDDNEQVWYYCETQNGKGYVATSDVRLIPSGRFAETP